MRHRSVGVALGAFSIFSSIAFAQQTSIEMPECVDLRLDQAKDLGGWMVIEQCPPTAGRFRLRFNVQPSGNVTDITVISMEIPPERLTQKSCLLEQAVHALKNLVFPVREHACTATWNWRLKGE